MNLNDLTSMGPLSDDQLAAMTHAQLSQLRDAYPDNKDMQIRIAPFEHQAFAREYTKERPVAGTLGLMGAIPLYQLAKVGGFMQNGGTATPPSLNQMTQAYKGVAQGLGLSK